MLLTLCAPHRDLMVERGRHEGKVDSADDAVFVFAAQLAGQPSFADAAIDEISSRELAQFDDGRCGVARSREQSVCEANSACQWSGFGVDAQLMLQSVVVYVLPLQQRVENVDLTYKCISQEDFDFIDALILSQASPEEAYRKFENLANRHIDSLRKITKNI